MRRLFGLFALLVGMSLLVSATSSAKDPEGRVLNTRATRSVKKPVEPVAQERAPLEALPTEVKPLQPIPTESDVEATSPATQTLTDDTISSEGTVVRTFEDIQVTEEEKLRAAAGKQAAAAEEQQIVGRVRTLQVLMEKEEQLLAQRLAYAARIREKGLADNDQKLLDQAERYERAALVEYEKKVQQFETMRVTNSAPAQPRRAPMPARSSRNPSPTRR
ncbi:MAG: hypothetical protein ACYC4U_06545 [Pirellulaceae bacterium]